MLQWSKSGCTVVAVATAAVVVDVVVVILLPQRPPPPHILRPTAHSALVRVSEVRRMPGEVQSRAAASVA